MKEEVVQGIDDYTQQVPDYRGGGGKGPVRLLAGRLPHRRRKSEQIVLRRIPDPIGNKIRGKRKEQSSVTFSVKEQLTLLSKYLLPACSEFEILPVMHLLLHLRGYVFGP
ncbi:hypothetical protein K1719_039835 [Acacia pycnantha]|nr:hypothetical protein K1719_039835 [Acacia pycnantha]